VTACGRGTDGGGIGERRRRERRGGEEDQGYKAMGSSQGGYRAEIQEKDERTKKEDGLVGGQLAAEGETLPLPAFLLPRRPDAEPLAFKRPCQSLKQITVLRSAQTGLVPGVVVRIMRRKGIWRIRRQGRTVLHVGAREQQLQLAAALIYGARLAETAKVGNLGRRSVRIQTGLPYRTIRPAKSAKAIAGIFISFSAQVICQQPLGASVIRTRRLAWSAWRYYSAIAWL
jgi:hypothetical protein